MGILIGVDEAGYGPVLGPLVVTATAFEIPNTSLNTSLWRILSDSITERLSTRDRRVAILDSKKLFQRPKGIKPLERTALVMATAADLDTRSLRAVLETVSPGTVTAMSDYPWYREFEIDLPIDNDVVSIQLAANAVKHNASTSGIKFLGFYSEVLLAGQFNKRVAQTRNKAAVSMGLALRTVARAGRIAGKSDPVHVYVDRQGGRTHYRDAIATAYDQMHVTIEEESDTRSAYRLGSASELRIEFLTRGESRQLSVALAGIWSKYIRELFMVGFNRYWQNHVGNLRPTAGYYQDAHRFLNDLSKATDQHESLRAMLVRSR